MRYDTTQSSRSTATLARIERSFTDEERALGVLWIFAEAAARKQQRAALRVWMDLSADDSPPAVSATTAPLAAAAAAIPAGPSGSISQNPIMGLQICDRFGKVCEILTILDEFKGFSAENPHNSIKNLQNTCQDLKIKLEFVLEYIRSILMPNGRINALLLTPYRLKTAGIRSLLWKKTMWEMESLMQKDDFSTNYLGQAYDAMTAIDSLMPAGL